MPDLSHHPLIAATVRTKLGTLRVEFTERGLAALKFGGNATGRHPLLRQLTRELQNYAAGRARQFTVPLDLSVGTVFQQKVWRALRAIPHGQTRSYAWVARNIGRPAAVRAVGAACGANPIPIIVPCHRVVRTDGSLGGYSGGLSTKRRLLRLEGVRCE